MKTSIIGYKIGVQYYTGIQNSVKQAVNILKKRKKYYVKLHLQNGRNQEIYKTQGITKSLQVHFVMVKTNEFTEKIKINQLIPATQQFHGAFQKLALNLHPLVSHIVQESISEPVSNSIMLG